MPDGDLGFDDLVRGEITFPAGTATDFVVVRPNGVPLYTFVNPVDDALMGVTHVLRGEDLLPSTARQIALYHALIDIGVTDFIPRFGHLPSVLGEGTKKLSKRDPESNLFHHRDRGFIPEGLVNYLALLGWAIGPDRDVFSMDELTAAFDVVNVNPNPARFDVKKAESINGDHIRMLEADDFAAAPRAVPRRPHPHRCRPRAAAPRRHPLVQERMQLLGEARDLLGFLFTPDEQLEVAADAMPGRERRRDPRSRDPRAEPDRRVDPRPPRVGAAHHPDRGRRLQAAGRVRPAAIRDLGPPDQPAAVRVDGAARQGLVAGATATPS